MPQSFVTACSAESRTNYRQASSSNPENCSSELPFLQQRNVIPHVSQVRAMEKDVEETVKKSVGAIDPRLQWLAF